MNRQSREDERVARALEGARSGRVDRGVVALAERIREVPAATGLDADPEFRAALRARVLADGAALLPRPRTAVEATPTTVDSPSVDGWSSRARTRRAQAARTRPPAGRRHRRRKAFAAATLVLATLSATTVAASGDALPGDPLYGLKRKVQGVEIIVARSDVDRGERHLELARTRVRELNMAGLSATPGPLLSALDDMDAETRAGIKLLSTAAVDGTDEARLAQLAAWTAEQRSLLIAATGRLPESAKARAAESLALLTTVAARIEELRGSLRCDCPPVKAPDDLGPRPCATGCGTTPAASPPPVQTQTRPARPTTTAPPAKPVPSWPAGPVGTASPGRAPTATGTGSAPPAGPNWPEPLPPAASPTASPPPAEPEPTVAPTSEPAGPETIPDIVTGVVGGLAGLLDLTR